MTLVIGDKIDGAKSEIIKKIELNNNLTFCMGDVYKKELDGEDQIFSNTENIFENIEKSNNISKTENYKKIEVKK